MFKNKVVVVTGSSSGIGQAVAEAFANQGAKVVINSKTNAVGGEKLASEIIAKGGQAIHIQANLSVEKDVEIFFSKIMEEYGTVDVLINNAGRTVAMDFSIATREHWVESLDENLISAVLCSQAASKIMLEQNVKGAIVNTSSVRGIGHTSREGIMAYSAAKAALINFSTALAKQLAPQVSVNAVCPGFVHTPYLDKVTEEQKENWLKLIPIKRFIEPDELAKAYLFLASSTYITGSTLVADGGFSLKIG